MAKQKKIPAKQAMYEQILTQQLYGNQQIRDEAFNSFKADYDAWNQRQQDLASFKSDYDNWVKAQTPVEQSTQPVEAPKVTAPKKQTVKQPKTEVKAEEKPIEKKTYLTHADIIPTLIKANPQKTDREKTDVVKQAALKWGISEAEARERLYPTQTTKLEAPGKVDEETTKKVQEAIAEEDRKKAQKKHGIWDAFTGRMAKASKDIVNAPVAIAGRIAGKDWSLYSDAQKQELKELQEQHPIASTAGDLAGMAFAAYTLGGGSKGVTPSGANAGEVARALRDEAILNGATKAQAAKYAAMGAIPTLTSNVAQAMPIDLATDIIPTLANDIAEGEKSDAEIVRDTLVNTGINAGFDAIGDIASIVKASRNMGNPVSADDAFRANINEGYEKIKRLNDIEAEKAVGDYKQYGNLTEINTKKLLNANNELDEIIKNNPNIDIIGSDIKKTPEIITAEKNAINDQVTSFLNGTMKPSEFLNLGHASGILQRYGVTDDDLYMLQRDIKKVLGRAGDNVRNSHNIGSGAFEAIPEKLEDPIAIIRSSSKNADDSVVVLTDLVDQEGHSVIAAIRINGDGNVKIDNQLTSYYGKNDIQKYLSSQAEKGNILYINEIKASADSAGHGLQSSAPVNPEASISNTAAVDSSKSLSNYDIADGIENVNKNSINNEGINVVKDMNFGDDLKQIYGQNGFEEAESFALPDDVFERVNDYAAELAKPLNDVQNSGIMETVTDEKALKEWAAVNKAYEDYIMKSIESADINEVEAARKAYDAARKRYSRAMKNISPEISEAFNSGSYGRIVGRPAYERKAIQKTAEEAQETADLIRELEEFNSGKTPVEAPEVKPIETPLEQSIDNVPRQREMAESMVGNKAAKEIEEAVIEEELPAGKGFVESGKSRVVTKSAVNANIIDVDALKNDPILQDIAKYEKHNNSDVFNSAMKRIEEEGDTWMNDIISGKKTIDSDVDVDSSMILLQDLANKIDTADDATRAALTAQRNSVLSKLREYGTRSGQGIQAFAKWNNTADGALLAANKLQEDEVIKPWVKSNKKAAEGNSRLARALADMGNKWKEPKEVVPLTHDQIKAGVKAELEKEFGSVEQLFNDNDLEFLTTLAEDKKIPVWQITDEIEHKLNFGEWYTLDESLPIKEPTNKKLQNALNSLIETGNVRAEKVEPNLYDIANEVRNTLNRESAKISSDFTDDDVNYLAGLIKGGATKEELANALNAKMAIGNFGISPETQQEITDIFKYIENKDPNSREFVEAQAEAFRLLAEEIAPKASFFEKFDTWRYMAMLGNPKTMLRNLVGNKMFGLITGFSNNLAALGEAGVDKAVKAFGGEGIQRTKAVLNPAKDGNLIKASADDVENSVFRQLQGSKYEKMDKDFLRRSRSVWNTKVMRKAEDLVDKGISDYGALKKKYSTSLAGYLKANGYNEAIFDAEERFAKLQRESKTRLLSSFEQAEMEDLSKQASALNKAREYAISQAEYATFHEDNAVADLLSKWSRDARGSNNKIANALGYAIEGTVPFKKTPANILRSGVEYSPLGAIDSIRKTGKLIYENTGKRAGNLADTYMKRTAKGTLKEVNKTLASDVIDSWSKTLTGTGLFGLGMYLYNKGIIHVADPDTKYQDQLEGIQNYAIDINGHSYTMDWAVPAFMPIFLGAEASKVNQSLGKTDEEGYKHISDYMDVANRLAEPMVETSMLQGIKDTLETAASTAQNNDTASVPLTLAYNSLTGYATQAIPTLSGQIARTVDNTRRATYSDKGDAIERVLDKQGKKMLNKIPGASMLNQPYVDTYGREQKNSPFNNPVMNFAYQALSPGYYSKRNTTNADKLSREVYDYNKTESVLPEYQTSFKDSEGNRVSPEDFTTASKAYGQANYDIRMSLANDEWFNSLKPEEKEEILKGVNTISKHVGKAAIDPNYSTTSKGYEAYSSGGLPSLKDYYKQEQAKNIAKESGLSSNSNASKEIQKEILNGNTEAAEQKISDASKIIDSGINAHGYDVYNARKGNIKDMDSWISEYKKIDSYGNSDGFVNQDEFISAIKKNGWSEEEAVKYAQIYGNWKQIPYLKKDGTWGFHKKK